MYKCGLEGNFPGDNALQLPGGNAEMGGKTAGGEEKLKFFCWCVHSGEQKPHTHAGDHTQTHAHGGQNAVRCGDL